ncbi:MAG: hypothetical protein M3069_28485 [Chloroflexota bacterium]|nr:hypothetical protein [Chloroflexota bacterium]
MASKRTFEITSLIFASAEFAYLLFDGAANQVFECELLVDQAKDYGGERGRGRSSASNPHLDLDGKERFHHAHTSDCRRAATVAEHMSPGTGPSA